MVAHFPSACASALLARRTPLLFTHADAGLDRCRSCGSRARGGACLCGQRVGIDSDALGDRRQTEVLARQVEQGLASTRTLRSTSASPDHGSILGARVLAEVGGDPDRYADAKAARTPPPVPWSSACRGTGELVYQVTVPKGGAVAETCVSPVGQDRVPTELSLAERPIALDSANER
jgi:hypothetical protein